MTHLKTMSRDAIGMSSAKTACGLTALVQQLRAVQQKITTPSGLAGEEEQQHNQVLADAEDAAYAAIGLYRSKSLEEFRQKLRLMIEAAGDVLGPTLHIPMPNGKIGGAGTAAVDKLIRGVLDDADRLLRAAETDDYPRKTTQTADPVVVIAGTYAAAVRKHELTEALLYPAKRTLSEFGNHRPVKGVDVVLEEQREVLVSEMGRLLDQFKAERATTLEGAMLQAAYASTLVTDCIAPPSDEANAQVRRDVRSVESMLWSVVAVLERISGTRMDAIAGDLFGYRHSNRWVVLDESQGVIDEAASILKVSLDGPEE